MIRLKISNHKIYKSWKAYDINIHPGNLKRLPDDCFFYSFAGYKNKRAK